MMEEFCLATLGVLYIFFPPSKFSVTVIKVNKSLNDFVKKKKKVFTTNIKVYINS